MMELLMITSNKNQEQYIEIEVIDLSISDDRALYGNAFTHSRIHESSRWMKIDSHFINHIHIVCLEKRELSIRKV